ncbi:unnamed protein product [Miscanthus lutarioriparius]|uniref:Uncharacterized protein n=1 Tax=Miscanthus lutarioriparius TaxID=422564 RepID=A0A811MZ09_9POAL|nr:unnamed protein product [Miscanthus lutarioriparius]
MAPSKTPCVVDSTWRRKLVMAASAETPCWCAAGSTWTTPRAQLMENLRSLAKQNTLLLPLAVIDTSTTSTPDGQGTTKGKKKKAILTRRVAKLVLKPYKSKQRAAATTDEDEDAIIADDDDPIAMVLAVRNESAGTELMYVPHWESESVVLPTRRRCGSWKEETSETIDWEALLHASFGEIEECIKDRGTQSQMTFRILLLLTRIKRDQGSIDLEWLRYIPCAKAKYELHCQLITFGKECKLIFLKSICAQDRPNCGACPFTKDCKYYKSLSERYIILDGHEILDKFEPRVHGDYKPYLFIIRGHDDYNVNATILVFADNSSTRSTIQIKRDILWDFERCRVYFGTSLATIARDILSL